MAARVTPLRRLPPPRYPTWDLVREDPALLAREVPARWQRRSAVVAALTAAALGTASAARQGASANRPAAVVFEHGEGKGSYGCVSVAPPAFLSEEEARQVVVSELSAAGVKLAAGDKQIPTSSGTGTTCCRRTRVRGTFRRRASKRAARRFRSVSIGTIPRSVSES